MSKQASTVRLDEAVHNAVARYAESQGISWNAAMNILVRASLRQLGAEDVHAHLNVPHREGE